MSEPPLFSRSPADEPSPPAGEVSPPADDAQAPAPRAWWLWISVGLILTAVVVAAVIVGVTSPGSRSTGSSPATSSAGGTPSPGPSSASATVASDEPGVFGKPSLPGTDPRDPWKGASPIAGVDPKAFAAALTASWQLDFRYRPMRGGSMAIGLAGDLNRSQRRLDAIVETDPAEAVYQVMCQAGGSAVTPVDDTSLRFVPDCLAQALHGDAWVQLHTWLEEHLATLASSGGDAWYQLPGVRLYAASDRHVVSCTLTNIP